MKKILLATVLVATAAGLSGCATEAKYRTKLDAMSGMTEDALVDQMGVPDNSYTSKDGKYVVYNRYDDPENKKDIVCETTFSLSGSKVVKSTFKGEDCTSN